MLHHMGATVVSKGTEWHVIKYPWRSGTHVATVGGHFLALAEALQQLHQDGVCHADMHACNVVFSFPFVRVVSAVIIDFDNSVCADAGFVYPPNWNGALPERHPDARSGQPILCEHDVFAFRAMMKQYTPVATEMAGVWAAIFEPGVSLPRCIDMLKPLRELCLHYSGV